MARMSRFRKPGLGALLFLRRRQSQRSGSLLGMGVPFAQFSGAISGVGIATGGTARCAASLRSTLRSDSAWRIWQRRSICCGTYDLLYSDDNDSGYIQSCNTGTIHTLFRRCAICDIHNIRNSAFRDEHESRANIRLSISRRLLARSLGLFHRAYIGHAGCGGGFSASSRGCRSLLRKAAPRQ